MPSQCTIEIDIKCGVSEGERETVGRIDEVQLLSVGDGCTVIGLTVSARPKGGAILVVEVDKGDILDGETGGESTPDAVFSADLLV